MGCISLEWGRAVMDVVGSSVSGHVNSTVRDDVTGMWLLMGPAPGMCAQADKERYAAFAKIKGLLSAASEELHDVPLYYNLHAVCKTLHVTPPSGDTVRSALINAGMNSCFPSCIA